MTTVHSISTDGDWKSVFPRALQNAAVRAHLGQRADDEPTGVPTLLTHPRDQWWSNTANEPAPLVLWFHGRTVEKELDPGRYLRWKRLGIAACAIDLPGHGERTADPKLQQASSTLRIAEQAAHEIDSVLTALADDRFGGAFDLSRVAIGGMSAGGMVTLIRLTADRGTRYAFNDSNYTFRAAIIEASAGDFTVMEGHDFFVPERVERLNPIDHLDRMNDPVPLLAVHSKNDAWVPVGGMTRFIDALRDRYRALGADPDNLARLHLWDHTGAPHEHMGFGTKTNDTKNLENDFLARHLGLAADAVT